MHGSKRAHKRMAGQGWLTTLLGVFVLVTGGFALGLIVGIVSEEPELVVGHVAGRSTEIDWSADPLEPISASATPAEPSTALAAAPDRAEAEPDAGPAPVAAPPERRREPAAAEALPPVAARAEPRDYAARRPPAAQFAIQVGAFGASAAAEQLATRLRKGGYPVAVISPSTDDRWRVRVGPIGSKAEAEQMARRLKVEERLPTWVLREQGT